MMRFLIRAGAPCIAAFMVISLFVDLYFLLSNAPIDLGFLRFISEKDLSTRSTSQLAVSLIPKIIFLYAMIRLFQLFRLFSANVFFSVEAISHLKWFSGAYMLSTFLAIIFNSLLFVSSTPETVVSLNINIDSHQISELGMAIVFYVVAYILNEARQHKEELEGYF